MWSFTFFIGLTYKPVEPFPLHCAVSEVELVKFAISTIQTISTN